MADVDNFSFRIDPTLGWSSDKDIDVFSLDLAFYTEGNIYFRVDGNTKAISKYLLEFYVELKRSLLKYLGTTSYETKVAMPLSGGGLIFSRNEQYITMEFRGAFTVGMTWFDFLKDFRRFEVELVKELDAHFPAVVHSKEFQLIYPSEAILG
ncbi:hypothetical protein [Celeribacter baekdonensis]|uniref:hypothetical protein n=1 Tax=Celeribacter baekdonensis TaxID=875171 RepID=UPI0030D8C3BE|tara:strand:- start:36603 stop:37058 length:456 start_codon:yes stop_codon:yes gene_type:complete